VLEIEIAGERRLIAVEDAARYRDALGISLPAGTAKSLLARVEKPALELVRRFARTHGPFTLPEIAGRFGLDPRKVEAVLRALVLEGRVLEGGFRPGGVHREWCDAEALRLIRRKSLARLRKEIEPVEQPMLARLETHWQGLLQRRRGLDALLDTIESLQGAPLPASLLESAILPARLARYSPGDLDTLIAAGEVAWCGLDSLGEHDGRIALYLADRMPLLLPPRLAESVPLGAREEAILDQLARGGAMFFAQLHEAVGGGFPGETLDALWRLVWHGGITNDTLHALRAYVAGPGSTRPAKRQHNLPSFRSRRTTPPTAQGRWTLLPNTDRSTPARQTEWSHAAAQQLLHRYGVLTRESVAQENLPGGFSAIYDVLKALEESGRIRRGYFVAGLGATQFALPAAVELLRSLRMAPPPEKPEIVSMAATDPANPYGSVLRWPQIVTDEDGNSENASRALTRNVGSSVILRNGQLIAYLRRNHPNLQAFLPLDEPDRSQAAGDLARFLAAQVQEQLQHDEARRHGGLLIATINGQPVHQHWMAGFLRDAGFHPAPMGFHMRRMPPALPSSAEVQ
jgi:ATP-dependent helicase Lhr and Lhr-like helicase